MLGGSLARRAKHGCEELVAEDSFGLKERVRNERVRRNIGSGRHHMEEKDFLHF
jgi:hypothetical protein